MTIDELLKAFDNLMINLDKTLLEGCYKDMALADLSLAKENFVKSITRQSTN